ncbi:hypothetical protein BC834DRAFT_90754 [Gloeopeniophorella convolvens]|nr:hypothetical protein BC834DRAFT_90754 [Gloeopeniophorella convolvens]
MHPETAPPSFLLIIPLVSFILIAPQVSSLRKSHWDTHGPQGTRRLLALWFTVFIALLSILSGALGLVASRAWHTGDTSRASHANVGGKIILVIIRSGLSACTMFILNLKALVGPTMIPSTNMANSDSIRTLTAVLAPALTGIIVISIVLAALQEGYPTARLPAFCWLVYLIPLCLITILLYLSIRRFKEHSFIARMWLVLTIGQACGIISAACSLVGKGDFQTPASLFDAIWATCVLLALHIYSGLPTRNSLSPLLTIRTPPRRQSGHVSIYSTRPSNAGSLQTLEPATTASAEDFCTLRDPFASPSSPFTEKPLPVLDAACIEQTRKKTLATALASTPGSSAGDLVMSQKLLESLEGDFGTPPPSPPAHAVLRTPRCASYNGAFGA